MKLKNKFALSIVATSLVFALGLSASATGIIPDNKEFNPEQFPIVTELEGEKADGIQPRTEKCACGGNLWTRKVSETGFIKSGTSKTCSHGMNGMQYINTITYVTECGTCHTGTSFTRKVTEIRCAH